MKWLCAVIIVTMLSLPALAGQKKVNFCYDQNSWEQWKQLVKKYPSDIPLQILHALRIGLCAKIEKGSINYDRAVDLINDMMNNLEDKRSQGERGNGWLMQ